MAAQGANLITLLSGGSSNTNQNLSLGGVKSTNSFDAQTVNYTTTGVTGITINSAWGFVLGRTYTLQLVTGFIILTDGINEETLLEVTTTSGEYVLSNNDSLFGMQITFNNATHVDETKTFTVTNPIENLFTSITSPESASGIEEYRCIYIENNGLKDLDLKLSLPGSDLIEDYKIGFDGNGVSVAAVIIANENVMPSGVIFTAPTESATLDISLTIGQWIGVWIQRILPPNNIVNKNPSIFQILIDMAHD